MRDSNRPLQHFRGEYGRLCTLVAIALRQGHDERAVIAASRGHVNAKTPFVPYTSLNRQREHVVRSLTSCKANGIAGADIVRVAREVRRAVEGEWAMHLPMFANVKPGDERRL